MGVVKVDEIRDQVDALLSRVEAGETILIEKDGKTVAQLTPSEGDQAQKRRPRKIDIGPLRAFTNSQPLQKESAEDFIRKMRDESRY